MKKGSLFFKKSREALFQGLGARPAPPVVGASRANYVRHSLRGFADHARIFRRERPGQAPSIDCQPGVFLQQLGGNNSHVY